jgi:hypothetical protein
MANQSLYEIFLQLTLSTVGLLAIFVIFKVEAIRNQITYYKDKYFTSIQRYSLNAGVTSNLKEVLERALKAKNMAKEYSEILNHPDGTEFFKVDLTHNYLPMREIQMLRKKMIKVFKFQLFCSCLTIATALLGLFIEIIYLEYLLLVSFSFCLLLAFKIILHSLDYLGAGLDNE